VSHRANFGVVCNELMIRGPPKLIVSGNTPPMIVTTNELDSMSNEVSRFSTSFKQVHYYTYRRSGERQTRNIWTSEGYLDIPIPNTFCQKIIHKNNSRNRRHHNSHCLSCAQSISLTFPLDWNMGLVENKIGLYILAVKYHITKTDLRSCML